MHIYCVEVKEALPTPNRHSRVHTGKQYLGEDMDKDKFIRLNGKKIKTPRVKVRD